MTVNARLATAALAALTIASTGSALAAPTLRLGHAPPMRHERFGDFIRRDAFRDDGRFRRALPLFGGYGSFYGPYPAITGYAPPAIAEGPAPAAVPPGPPYNNSQVCPAVWTWSAKAGGATRRNLCD